MARMTKTLYWDSQKAQYVYIVWDPKALRGKHHKLPKTENTEEKARSYIRRNKL